MSFARPLWLLGLALIPLLAWLEARQRRQDRRRLEGFLSGPMIDRLGRVTTARRVLLSRILIFAGCALLLLALARPQWGAVRERIERAGADVVFVVDTSLSMSVEDVAPNRFFLARQAILNLMAQLPGDRFALVAFEGEAYALVPLTLDADAVALFLETMEPGFVPTPGSNLQAGIDRGIAAFLDAGGSGGAPGARQRVIVLVSDGEDLESGVEGAIGAARRAGVQVHSVGVGTTAGGPVPDTDSAGERRGFKLENGSPVISRLRLETLERLATETAGIFTTISSADTTLSSVANAVLAAEGRGRAEEFAFRRGERFQIPLGLGVLCLFAGLFGPLVAPIATLATSGARALRSLFPRRRGLTAAALIVASAMTPLAATARADWRDELLARPSRATENGRRALESGETAKALEQFEAARRARPLDSRTRFNEALGNARAGNADAAARMFLDLSREPNGPLVFESHYNRGNVALQAKDYGSAISAYRDALRLRPADPNARRNLEIALRALEKQQNDQKQQPEQPEQQSGDEKRPSPRPTPEPRNDTERHQQEEKRFQRETGMKKEQAMQLLAALEEKEKQEQKRRLDAERRKRRQGRDW